MSSVESSSTTTHARRRMGLGRDRAGDALDVRGLVAHGRDDENPGVHVPSNVLDARASAKLCHEGARSWRRRVSRACAGSAASPRPTHARVRSTIRRLAAMTSAIEHRGPDEAGHAIHARRRARHAPAEHHRRRRQPPAGRRPRTTRSRAVFNGEIFNFPELRARAGGKGHRLATDGDSETIVHLYEEHGPDFVRRLRGMFAHRAVGQAAPPARAGPRPHGRQAALLRRTRPTGLAFASEVKALLAGGLVRAELDPLAAELFLAHGFVPGPYTLFAGVRKLDAGVADGLRGRRRIVEQRAYWNPWEDGPPRAARRGRRSRSG